jgi:hypothetical protein
MEAVCKYMKLLQLLVCTTNSLLSVAFVRRLQQFLLGKLGSLASIQDVEVSFLSLHQVTAKRRALDQLQQLAPRAKWSFNEVSSLLFIVCHHLI